MCKTFIYLFIEWPFTESLLSACRFVREKVSMRASAAKDDITASK